MRSTWRCCAAAAAVVATRVTCGTWRLPARAFGRTAPTGLAATSAGLAVIGFAATAACWAFFSMMALAALRGARTTVFLTCGAAFFFAAVVTLRLLAILFRAAVCFFI